MTKKTKAPNRYRYVVFWNNSEHYCEASNDAEACRSAAEAWATRTRGKKELYITLLIEATVVRLRKIERPKASF